MMNRIKKLVLRIFAASVLVLPASTMLLSSCDGQGGTVCADICDCTHCNDRDEELCIVSANKEAERAAAYDCVAEYDSYVDCILGSSNCDVDEDITLITYEVDEDCLTDDFVDYAECLVDATDHDNDVPY